MPKFKTDTFTFQDKGNPDSTIQFKSDINISEDGWFYTNLPEHIAAQLQAGGVFPGQRVVTNGRFGKVVDRSYDGLKGKISELFAEYFSKELISDELMIEYFIASSVSYCKCADGELVPNGEWQRRKDGTYAWADSIGPSVVDGTGVSFYAKPIRRKIYAYKSGTQIIKDEAVSSREDPGAIGEDLYWLASVVTKKPAMTNFQYIEATAPVCRFFIGLYLSMWGINERIKDITKPEQIKALAESKFKLLS